MTSATQSAAPLALLLALHETFTFTPFMSVKKKAPSNIRKKKKKKGKCKSRSQSYVDVPPYITFLIPYRIEKDKIEWSYGERKKVLLADRR